ncbi:hypothetical protein CYK57_00474 [Actinobacillus pleuropneumoniae]|nr:hypothetical protein appser2_3600 [Actinobacillus pleuropneumoniae serovar 2 str. S1536]QSZ38347.1 hypothetical protein CYK57_00474 [Actinobacillus pleuropneumoniae]
MIQNQTACSSPLLVSAASGFFYLLFPLNLGYNLSQNISHNVEYR